MKKILFVFFISLLSFTICQDFAGGKIPHFATGIKVIQANPGTLTDGDVYPIPLQTTFDASQMVNVATSLLDFTYARIVDYSNGQKDQYATFGISAIQINAAKTQLNLKIVTNPQNTASIALSSQKFAMKRVTLSYIVVGSNTDGPYDSGSTILPSSYIFARNSQFTQSYSNGVSYGPATIPFNYDFMAAQSKQSPFNYNQALNTRCGAVYRDNNWAIQSKGCQRIIAYLQITGFIIPTTTGNNPSNLQVNRWDSSTLLGSQQIEVDASVFTSGGLPVTFKSTKAPYVQLSLVVIALRQYNDATYPDQGTSIDSWKANSYITATPGNNKAGVVTIATDGTLANVLENANVDNGKKILQKGQYDSTKFGHRFCGLNYLQLKTDSNKVYNIGFKLNSLNLDTQKFSTALQPSTPAVSVDETKENQLKADSNFDYNCLLFTLKTACQDNLQTVLLADSNPVITASASVLASIAAISDQPDYKNLAAANPDLKDVVQRIANQKFSSSGRVQYDFNIYTAKSKQGVYEGVLYFKQPLLGAQATSVYQNIDLRIFGNQIILKRQNILGLPLHFSFENSNIDDNTIKIVYSIQPLPTGTLPTLPDQKVQFGLIYHTKVLNAQTQACEGFCVDRAGFSIGSDTNLNPPACVQCQTSKNLVFDPLAESCSCLPGYYKQGTSCQVCTLPLCGTCQAGSCSQCVSHAIFLDAADTSKGCKCDAGYYRDGSVCRSCPSGCSTCTNSAVCTSCKVESPAVINPTRKSPENVCACIDRYYDNGNTLCQKCAPECATCQGSANKCKTCPEHGSVVGTTCKCDNGYYSALDLKGQGVCLRCSYGCKTCAEDAAKCIECKTDIWKQQAGGACVCDGDLQFVEYADQVIDAVCVDRSCSTIDANCVQCQVVFNQQANRVCSKCNSVKNWIVSATDNKKCECMVGFYQSGANCLPCGQGCQKCTSPTTCTLCATGSSSNVQGTCSCPLGTFLSQVDNTLQCLPCDANCAQCQTTSSKCSNCINGFVARGNVCVCEAKKFITPDGLYCRNCISGCQTCKNEGTCDACQSNYLLSDDKTRCVLDCGLGFYNSGPSCQRCSAGCADCRSFIECRTCSNGFYEYLGSCRDTCPRGTYNDPSKKCIACNPNCASCSVNPNNCQDCQKGFISHNNQCLQKCPSKFYYSGVKCQPCSSACENCQGAADKCTSCPTTTQYLYQNKCHAQCPTVIVGGVCTNICQEGTYLDGRVCKPCNVNCRICSSPTFCSNCKGALVSYKGQCLSGCPANTIRSGSSCSDCDRSCIGCSGSVTSCVKCQPNLYRIGQKCSNTCPFRFYPDQSSYTCKPCDASCQICSGPGRCSLCMDNSAPTNGVCAVNCGAGCLECSNSVCSKCAQNYYSVGPLCTTVCPGGSAPVGQSCVCNGIWHLGNCVATCPDGFVKVGTSCQACTSPCKTCSSAVQKCDSCIDGYNHDQVAKKCTKKSDCTQGEYLSTFGECRFICPQGSYYLDSACYSGRCPVGFVKNNEKRICTKQTSPAGCSHPYFLQGSRCVSTCDQGFYANVNNRVCEVCSSNCLSCSGPNVCECCNEGSTLVGNVCVILPDACPVGQFRFNSQCLNSCPVGTFNKNGFCVRLCNPGLYYFMMGCYDSCSTNLYTSEACVLVCPVGYTKNGNKCSPATQSCSSNQFFNAYSAKCETCRSPCSSCAGTSTFCTNCVQGFNLKGGSCFSESTCQQGFYSSNQGCQKCAPKCNTCSDYNRCTSCASDYVNTGADCIPGSNNLQRLVLEVVSTVRCGNVVYIKIRPNILPNDLPKSLESSILLLISNNPVPCQVNVWIRDGLIFVAITFYSYIPSSQITLVPNSEALGSLFANIGYTTQNVLVTINISQSLGEVPQNTYTVPSYASFSQVYSSQTLSKAINQKLNSDVVKAVKTAEILGRN